MASSAPRPRNPPTGSAVMTPASVGVVTRRPRVRGRGGCGAFKPSPIGQNTHGSKSRRDVAAPPGDHGPAPVILTEGPPPPAKTCTPRWPGVERAKRAKPLEEREEKGPSPGGATEPG